MAQKKKINGNVGMGIRMLRQRSGMTLRALAKRAGVTPGMISCVENGKASPSMVTLEKILIALNTSFSAFFGAAQEAPKGPVYPRESMRIVSDKERTFTMLFPGEEGVGMEMMDEVFHPSGHKPGFTAQTRDIAGYVLSGAMEIEIKNKKPMKLRTGDAFYVKQGVSHRGYATGSESARLITAMAVG